MNEQRAGSEATGLHLKKLSPGGTLELRWRDSDVDTPNFSRLTFFLKAFSDFCLDSGAKTRWRTPAARQDHERMPSLRTINETFHKALL